MKSLALPIHNSLRASLRESSSFTGVTIIFESYRIVNSIFLQRPQKRGHGNQLIHRRLSRTKSIGSGSNPESQAGIQRDGYGEWCEYLAYNSLLQLSLLFHNL